MTGRPRDDDPASARALPRGREMARKGLHLLFAAVPVALAAGVAVAPLLSLLVTMLGLAVALELVRGRVPTVEAAFTRVVGPLLRDREYTHWTGATWLIAVSVAAVWLLPRPDAIAVTWAAAAGDASAALVGTTVGGLVIARASPRAKSIEGSAACFVATFAGAYWLAGLAPEAALAAAAAATVAERPQLALDDNLRVGAAVTAALLVASLVTHRGGV